MIITQDIVDNFTKAYWIIFPAGFISSILVFIYIIYRAGKKRNRYVLLIKILSFCTILVTLHNVLILFSPDILIIDWSHRIMALLGGWPAFLIIWLTMICDMELLKLLQILTPFFTTDRIKVIQIIETIVSFGLGGGVLLWPFSDFDYAGLISKWYNFTILLQLISAMLVAVQCTYISIKMYQFAVRKKGQDGVKIRQKTYRAIFLVLLFLCNGLFIATAALVGALMSTTSDATTNRLSTLLYATSGIPTPFQILIYYHIFESIKGIKFERITPKKSVTVVN